jgi:hypothetical protein
LDARLRRYCEGGKNRSRQTAAGEITKVSHVCLL